VILQEQKQLATTVLDALSNLNLGADLLAEVRGHEQLKLTDVSFNVITSEMFCQLHCKWI